MVWNLGLKQREQAYSSCSKQCHRLSLIIMNNLQNINSSQGKDLFSEQEEALAGSDSDSPFPFGPGKNKKFICHGLNRAVPTVA